MTGKPMRSQFQSEYKTQMGNHVDTGCFSNPGVVSRLNKWHKQRLGDL